MDESAYRSYLKGRNFPEERIDQFVASVKKFEEFLRQQEKRRREVEEGDMPQVFMLS